jgi:hypothetical protein
MTQQEKNAIRRELGLAPRFAPNYRDIDKSMLRYWGKYGIICGMKTGLDIGLHSMLDKT